MLSVGFDMDPSENPPRLKKSVHCDQPALGRGKKQRLLLPPAYNPVHICRASRHSYKRIRGLQGNGNREVHGWQA